MMSPEEIIAAGDAVLGEPTRTAGLAGQGPGWLMRAVGSLFSAFGIQIATGLGKLDTLAAAPISIAGTLPPLGQQAVVDVTGATRVQRIEFVNLGGGAVDVAIENGSGAQRYSTTTLKPGERATVGNFALNAGLRLRPLAGTNTNLAATYWAVFKN